MCGYVCNKGRVFCENTNEISDTLHLTKEAEFTINLLSGKLQLSTYNLSQYCFTFFKGRKVKSCTKMHLQVFQEKCNSTGYTFKNIEKTDRHLCNWFLKYLQRDTDKVSSSEDKRATKKRRLYQSHG